jgi:TPP-dependent pyruvate/acetoin dehydrogenase alpha subunit
MTTDQKFYYDMLRIRKIELEIAKRYPEGQMRCPVHLSVGQEEAAVFVASTMGPDDLMVSTHRGHAHYLARGGSLRGLLCELYGKADGCSRGQGGSMHLVDWSVGFAGSTSIVGGTIPVGVGLAFAKKLKGEPGKVVICIGDAAVEEGVFHESHNFALLHDLNVLFFIENNYYSCYTHIDERQPGGNLGQIFAKGKVDVFETYRHLEHCGPNNDDHLNYRPFVDREWSKLNDPISRRATKLIEKEEWTKEFVASLSKIDEEIEKEFTYATNAPYPDKSELGKYLYAD